MGVWVTLDQAGDKCEVARVFWVPPGQRERLSPRAVPRHSRRAPSVLPPPPFPSHPIAHRTQFLVCPADTCPHAMPQRAGSHDGLALQIRAGLSGSIHWLSLVVRSYRIANGRFFFKLSRTSFHQFMEHHPGALCQKVYQKVLPRSYESEGGVCYAANSTFRFVGQLLCEANSRFICGEWAEEIRKLLFALLTEPCK